MTKTKEKLTCSENSSMDISKYSADYEWAVGLNRITLKILCIWPKDNETRQEKLLSNIRVALILSVIIFICVIPTLHSLVRVWGNIMLVMDNLQYTLSIIMALIKFSVMLLKKKNVLPLLNVINNDWIKPKLLQEKDVMIKSARVARTFTIFGYFIMLISLTLAVLLPSFGISTRYITNKTDPGKLVPLQTYYLYDRDKSPFYELTFSLQSISFIGIALMYTSVDSLLAVLVFHVCGQLENLKTRIIHMNKFQNFENALSHNVQDHMRLIRFINMIDNIYTLILFSALFYFGILFACYGFLMISLLSQDNNMSMQRTIFIMTIFINTFAHTCLYCAIGEVLVTKNEGIYKSVCKYKWYKLEPKKAKNVMFIMVRTNKSLCLTAGKLIPMTMSTFCNLLKTSAGYISFLLAYQE